MYVAIYVCVSRISDYKHHWSDVLGGAVLGIVIALLVVSLVLACVSAIDERLIKINSKYNNRHAASILLQSL